MARTKAHHLPADYQGRAQKEDGYQVTHLPPHQEGRHQEGRHPEGFHMSLVLSSPSLSNSEVPVHSPPGHSAQDCQHSRDEEEVRHQLSHEGDETQGGVA